MKDAWGLETSCASQRALDLYAGVIEGYLRNRNDTAQRLKACLAEDGDFCMAHVLRTAFAMSAFKAENEGFARRCLADAQRVAAQANERERAHVEAVRLWVEGDVDGAMSAWDAIAQQWPRDVVAIRLHHFIGFWSGRPEAMTSLIERVLPHWSRALPGYAALLGCRAFAHEEAGAYIIAENAGRAAIALDPGDIWAVHALAHVYEMQGRTSEGLLLLDSIEAIAEGGNNLLHHLWWHRALYHFERGDFDAALDHYDSKFRNLNAPLTMQMPDLYIDIQNAASMLWRLEQAGVGVGARWEELGEKSSARVDDCANAFTLPHFMLALLRTGRGDAAQALIEGMRAHVSRHAKQGGGAAPVRDAALPICEAMMAQARGDARGALDLMRPALGVMHGMGGSHAQQDMLERFFAACAREAGAQDDLRLILQRVRARRPLPPEARRGWRDFATALA